MSDKMKRMTKRQAAKLAQGELATAIESLGRATTFLLCAHETLMVSGVPGTQGVQIEELGRQIERATRELRNIRIHGAV